MEKENTKKNKKNFKKSEGTINHDFIEIKKLRGKTDCVNSGKTSISFYVNTELEYQDYTKKLEAEMDFLFDCILQDKIHPFILNLSKKKSEIESFLESPEGNENINNLALSIINLEPEEFPIIFIILDNVIAEIGKLNHTNYLNSVCQEKKEKILFSSIQNIIFESIRRNQNIKNIFNIRTPEKADYILSKYQYVGKSKSWYANKSREWRGRAEKYRRRQERRERKNNIEF
tara:strand:+ start:466 stop:1158 length:693 start_codon:yes stop_codon:yes gene_type:complete